MREKIVGSNNPNWKGGEHRECPICGKTFWWSPGHNQRTCSKACGYALRKNANWSQETCGYCGKVFSAPNFEIIKSSLRGRGAVYCSKRCGNLSKTGCNNPNFIHGKSDKSIYSRWRDMMDRCYNPKDRFFNIYGGRGIKVCDEWHDFLRFYQDMGDPPRDMTLDRIDTNGDYTLENVRWATPKQQARNQRRNHVIEFNGQSHCVAEWEEILGIRNGTLKDRLLRGWPISKALTEPIKPISGGFDGQTKCILGL